MLTTVLILSLLAVSGVQSTCNCFTANTTSKKIGIANAYDTADFSACYSAPCGFVASSGDATVGWTSITVTLTPTDPTGVITIYDGPDDGPTRSVIQTISTSGTYGLTSSTQSVYVKYTQNDKTKPNTYYGSMIASSGLAPPTTTAPSTLAPTTRAFTDPAYSKDPYSISHDLLVLVNQKTDLGLDGLTALNTLASNFVNQLSITTDFTQTTQTRLGLATLTPYKPNYAVQGEIWNMKKADFAPALPKTGVSSPVDITYALNAMVPAFFDTTDPVAPTRKTVQRSIILFTAWWSDDNVLDDLVTVFNNWGVNLAIVTYNTTSSKLIPNSWYNYAPLTSTTAADVASFVNRFYLNSGLGNSLTNNWCPPGPNPTLAANIIQEPQNYNGADLKTPTWSAGSGQLARYCNFQDTTYYYVRNKADKKVKVTVFYELEVEKDYLKFFADGVEIESFTGNDVSSANFLVDANTISARFTTDNSGVFRGFKATFEEVTSP